MKDDTWKWILSIGCVGLLGWMILGKNDQASDTTEGAVDDDAEYPPVTDEEYYQLRPHLLLRGKEAADWHREQWRKGIYAEDDPFGRQILAESMARRAAYLKDPVLMEAAQAELEEAIENMDADDAALVIAEFDRAAGRKRSSIKRKLIR